MANQITSSLTRIPAASASLVELRTASSLTPPSGPPKSVHPEITEKSPSSSSSSSYSLTTSPTLSSSLSTSSTIDSSSRGTSPLPMEWKTPSPPQERQSRDRTRRGAAPSILQQLQQRSRSLPPHPRLAATTTPAVTATAPVISPNAPIIAYTDASAVPHASGIGIYFGDNHPLNTSRELPGPVHESGIGEILAAQTALAKILEWKEYKGQPVIIRTDYLGVIDAMNNGNFGRYAGLYADLRRIAERFPSVTFEHVYGHDGERGNEEADALARRAIRLRKRSESPAGRAGARSGSRGGRSRSATVKGRRKMKNSPVKVSDTTKVPPPDRSRSRSRDRKRNKSRSSSSRSEVIRGVPKGKTSTTRSVRSMERSEKENLRRRQKQLRNGRSPRSSRSSRSDKK